MTDSEPAITTRAELNEAMLTALRRAYAGGVDVEGGWDCRNGADHPDWDVVVTKVATTEAPE